MVVRNLREQGLLCADHALRRGDREEVMLEESEVALLEEAGVIVDFLTPAPQPPRTDDLVTGFVSDYLDAPGIDAAYQNLHSLFPALTSYTALPEPTSGYDGSVAALAGPSPVKMFRITTTPAIFSKPGLLIVAGLHAREWAPPLAAIEFASELLHNYDPASVDPQVIALNALVDALDILIVGAANPDGIDYSHHDEALWRKNRRPNAGFPSCPGVDLNRNFSIYWGQAGSSPDPCDYQVFHGPAPFSEAEDRNLRWIAEQFPNLLTAIDCHSYGENFYRPQPSGGTYIGAEPVPPADDSIYLALEAAMNAAVTVATPGKTYATGTTSNHAGTFDEYMYFGHRIFGFEVEIGQDFQPPIAEGLVAVREAAGAMLALAQQTLNLSARFLSPVAIVQVIDKSGSMISSGYVDATRGNAERLVDLMSLNDSTAVVSFNGAAQVEAPLTPLLSAGDYAAPRAAIAGIAFGGATSIGAGLQLGLSLLPPAGEPRCLLLLSDGFENTAPTVASVLPTVPAGVAIHTVALGAASDQALLENIASATGGTYFFSPDELGLFEIYSAAHAGMSDHDMVMSDSVTLPYGNEPSHERVFTRVATVECDADYAEFSVAAQTDGFRLAVELECLSVPFADLRRVERKQGPGYQVLRIRRPQPGLYRLTVKAFGGGPLTCSVAAFVKSPVRFRWAGPRALEFHVSEGERAIENVSFAAQALVPATSIRLLAARWKKEMGMPERGSADPLNESVALGEQVRAYLLRTQGSDPLQYVRRKLHLVCPRQGGELGVNLPLAKSIDGTYNVRLSARGRTASGCPFTRVALRSRFVAGND